MKEEFARKPLERPEVAYVVLVMTDVICASADPEEPVTLPPMSNAGSNTDDDYITYKGFTAPAATPSVSGKPGDTEDGFITYRGFGDLFGK